MRHPQRQSAAAQHAAERAELPLAGENKVELRPGLPDAAAGVSLRGRAQLAEPVFCIVKARDGFVERFGREIGQRLLEPAEGDCRLIKITAVARRVEAESAGDKIIGPPVLSLRVDGELSAVLRRAEADRLHPDIFARDEARNCVDILDQLLRVMKRDAVDALERIGFPGGACDTEGSVDMPVSERLARDGRSVQTNLL